MCLFKLVVKSIWNFLLLIPKIWPLTPHKEVIVFCVWISFKCQQQVAMAFCGESLLLLHRQTHKYIVFWGITELFSIYTFRFLQRSMQQCLFRYSDVNVYFRLLTLTNIWSSGECYMVILPEVDGCLPFFSDSELSWMTLTWHILI